MKTLKVAQDLFDSTRDKPADPNPTNPNNSNSTNNSTLDGGNLNSETTNSTVENNNIFSDFFDSSFIEDFNQRVFNQDQLSSFISALHYFTLAWCIFYSVLYTCNFFYNRMLYSDGEVDKEVQGVSQLYTAMKIWRGFFICLASLVLYKLFPIFAYITIFVYLFKLIRWDGPRVIDVIDNNFGMNGILTWYKNITTPLKKLLQISFKKK